MTSDELCLHLSRVQRKDYVYRIDYVYRTECKCPKPWQYENNNVTNKYQEIKEKK